MSGPEYSEGEIPAPGMAGIQLNQAGIAQLVEQRIRNAWVGGSTPSSGTIKILIEVKAPRSIGPRITNAVGRGLTETVPGFRPSGALKCAQIRS
jgi:hypothetical protein